MTGRQVRLFSAAAALFGVFGVLAAFVAVGGRAAPGPDRWVADHLFGLSREHAWLGAAARVVGLVTEPTVLRVTSTLLVLGLVVEGRRRAAGWLGVTIVLGGLLGIGAKLVYTRPRPVWEVPITTISGYSFPSGHATNSVVFVGVLLVVFGMTVRRWLAAFAFVLVVGLDRMFLGVHYLSDVVGGWAFGAGLVLVMLGLWPPVPLASVLPPSDSPVPGRRLG